MESFKSRGKLFIENFLVYGIGSTLNRLIPFVMLPILTRLYPDSTYIGINDSVALVVSFTSQIAILGVYDAMYRYFFEKEDAENQQQVASSALCITLCSGLIDTVILIAFQKPLAYLVFSDEAMSPLMYIIAAYTYSTALNAIIAAPTRMRNQRGRYLLINGITSFCIYAIALPLVLQGYYLYAMPLAAMVTSLLSVAAFWFYNHGEFSLGCVQMDKIRDLLKLGIPCVPSFIFYWILNSAQLVIITNILGMQSTGIYSVGAKIATISQLIYAAFAAGWQYFAFSTMKDADHIQLISKVFDYLGAISAFTTGCVILFIKPVFGLLFPPAYSAGVVVVPALFIAPLLQMLYQCAGVQFVVQKKPYVSPLCLLCAAITTLALDYLLIPRFGFSGAAMAVLSGFCVALVLMLRSLIKRSLFMIRFRIILPGLLIIVACYAFALESNRTVYNLLATASLILLVILYAKDGRFFIKKLIGERRSSNE